MPWLDRLARLRGDRPDPDPALGHHDPEHRKTEEHETLGVQKEFDALNTSEPASLAAAPATITTILVGLDIEPSVDPGHLLDLMASLEELAAVIFRKGDASYPAGPAELLLVCTERTPEEVQEPILRFQRAAAPLGTLRAAVMTVDASAAGDPGRLVEELRPALEIGRATGMTTVDSSVLEQSPTI